MQVNELRAELVRQDKSMNDLREFLKISKSAMHRKMNGSSEFKQSEIVLIREFLALSSNQVEVIFFNKKVS